MEIGLKEGPLRAAHPQWGPHNKGIRRSRPRGEVGPGELGPAEKSAPGELGPISRRTRPHQPENSAPSAGELGPLQPENSAP